MTALGDGPSWPGMAWEHVDPAAVGLDAPGWSEARDYALTGGGSGCIVRGGRLVLRLGRPATTLRPEIDDQVDRRHGPGPGAAGRQGRSSTTRPRKHHPDLGVPPESNAEDRLARSDHDPPSSRRRRPASRSPAATSQLLFEPGTQLALQRRRPELAGRVPHAGLRPGPGRPDVRAGLHADRHHAATTSPGGRTATARTRSTASSGASSARASAPTSMRWPGSAYLYLRGGRWQDGTHPAPRLRRRGPHVPARRGRPARARRAAHGDASDHYGLLWWNNADGTLPGVPPRRLLVVGPVRQPDRRHPQPGPRRRPGRPVVGARREAQATTTCCGPSSSRSSRRCGRASVGLAGPVPAQPRHRRHRLGAGGDDRPPGRRAATTGRLTWGDDDALYTAYGDGRGFEPFVPEKLSLGLAEGRRARPTDFRGVNIPSPTVEQNGDGATGAKASGMLMVDGALYIWARNAGNAQLGLVGRPRADLDLGRLEVHRRASAARRSSTSARDYAGGPRRVRLRLLARRRQRLRARPTGWCWPACRRADIRERAAYEFFAGLDAEDAAALDRRHRRARRRLRRTPAAATARRSPTTRRSSVTSGARSAPATTPRFAGGLAIYDAPEPWGPWTTVYLTEDWDVGPGERQLPDEVDGGRRPGRPPTWSSRATTASRSAGPGWITPRGP